MVWRDGGNLTSADVENDAAGAELESKGRILHAAHGHMVRHGWGSASLSRVATAAGVSKALIHYHFSDKCQLLLAIAAECSRNVKNRGRTTRSTHGSNDALEEFWIWLAEELHTGDVRVLLDLAYAEDADVREGARRALAAWRNETRHQVDRVLRRLEIAPRIGVGLVANVAATLAEGLAMQHDPRRLEEERNVVDTFWLSVIALGQ